MKHHPLIMYHLMQSQEQTALYHVAVLQLPLFNGTHNLSSDSACACAWCLVLGAFAWSLTPKATLRGSGQSEVLKRCSHAQTKRLLSNKTRLVCSSQNRAVKHISPRAYLD
jgi:hypothetical protein